MMTKPNWRNSPSNLGWNLGLALVAAVSPIVHGLKSVNLDNAVHCVVAEG